MELNWLEGVEETEDLSSKKPLALENETECRLGDAGLGVLEGDTDADRLGGETGGVRRGVLVWEASNRPCGTRGGLEAINHEKRMIRTKKCPLLKALIGNGGCVLYWA